MSCSAWIVATISRIAPGALGADLGQHGVGDAAGDVGGVGIVEVLVEVGGHLALVEREPAAERDAERVDAGRPVERRGDRRPPVDDDRIVRVVLDVAPADVPLLDRARPSIGVDAPEEVAGARRSAGRRAPRRPSSRRTRR